MSQNDRKQASLEVRVLRRKANESLGMIELAMLRRFGRMPNLHPDADGPDYFYPEEETKH